MLHEISLRGGGISSSADDDQRYAALEDFALCGARQGLLALDLARFLKKAGQKLFTEKFFDRIEKKGNV